MNLFRLSYLTGVPVSTLYGQQILQRYFQTEFHKRAMKAGK